MFTASYYNLHSLLGLYSTRLSAIGANLRRSQLIELSNSWITSYRMASLVVGCICIVSASLPAASGQVIVPVSREFRAPNNFTFQGSWVCSDGPQRAYIEVGPEKGSSQAALSHSWIALREEEEWFKGDYLVGYDSDKHQFLLIDAKDPAAIHYSTHGWDGDQLTLTSGVSEGSATFPHRILYRLEGPSRFTVTWQLYENGSFQSYAPSDCTRVADHQ
jgi:hypothetical protein